METKIFDYGMNGEGIAKENGKVLMINNALVDEVVEVELQHEFNNYAIGQTKTIIKSSPNRQQPLCPYFYQCGGCQLQHMNYNEQLKLKTNLIKKSIKKITNLNVDVNNTVPCSKQYGYRNKMSFSVFKTDCGLLKYNSKDIVNITHCPLATDDINKILNIFKEFINLYEYDCIKNLVVRGIDNQYLVGVVTSKHVELKKLLSTLQSQFVDIGLFEIINNRKDSVVLSGKTTHIGGIKTININNFDLNYSVDLLGFHQTNIDIQNKIYKDVLKFINPNSVVINGFSGQGLLTAIVAKKAKHVIGIEINASSHNSAEKLKQHNNLKNITNICGDFYKHFKTEKSKIDTIILDPTKKGCGTNVMNEINGVENIIYISCNPIALSKDLNVIKDYYTIEEITPYDMFPNTINVETLVKLKKKTL